MADLFISFRKQAQHKLITTHGLPTSICVIFLLWFVFL